MLDLVNSRRERDRGRTFFPLDPRGRLMISKPILTSGPKTYVAGLYKAKFNEARIGLQDRKDMAVEVIQCTEYRGAVDLTISRDSVVPVLLAGRTPGKRVADRVINGILRRKPPSPPSMSINGHRTEFGSPAQDRVFYLNCGSKDRVRIENDGEGIFVGSEIVRRNAQGSRLVLPIFVDGFAAKFLEYEGLQGVMPRTHDFFSKGTIFNRAYSNGEWSLPSCATIFTGLRTKRHGMWHSKDGRILSEEVKLLPEFFQENGYYSFQVCGNWRKNPALGYARGFNRTIYKREIECSEVVSEFMDQLLALPENDIFAWLTFFDLHRPWPYRQPMMSVQSRLSPHDLSLGSEMRKKSISHGFDEVAVRSYKQELGRLDFWLGQVFDFIMKRYPEENFLVCLFADHGQSYFDDSGYELGEKRTHVPLMLRGSGVPNVVSDELVQLTDILPSLLSMSGLDLPGGIDGRLPKVLGGHSERSFAFSETAFAGRKYRCIYRFGDQEICFSSKDIFQGYDGLRSDKNVLLDSDPSASSEIDDAHLSIAREDLKTYLGLSAGN